MKPLLLDTHVWIWYINGNEELSRSVRQVITTALHENNASLAAISLWEIGMLEKKQRIILEMPCQEWIKQSLALTHLRIQPLTPEIATEACQLPGNFHEDPADRMIVATARVEGLTLLTRDKRILEYGRHKYLSTLKA